LLWFGLLGLLGLGGILLALDSPLWSTRVLGLNRMAVAKREQRYSAAQLVSDFEAGVPNGAPETMHRVGL
jgi:hypothetical protein